MLTTTCILALTVTIANASVADEERQTEERARALEPTPSDLAAFQLTAETDVVRDTGSPLFDVAGAGMFAASGADLATTELGLSQGLLEGNPAASQRGWRIATHLAGPIAVYWATSKLNRAGKPKLALALRIGLTAVYSFAAIHNTRLIGSTTGVP